MLKRFSEHIRLQPEKTILTFLRDGEKDAVSLSFSELEDRARKIASRLLVHAPKGSRALLLHPPGLEFCSALLGCFYAGIIAVPCYPPSSKLSSRSGERFLRLARHCDAAIALTDSSNISRLLPHFRQSSVKLLATDSPFEEQSIALPEIIDSDLALIQYTSGSTGSPKGVMLTHANLAANLESIMLRYELSESSTVVSWLPPYHDMGLIGGILSALHCGYPLVMMEPRHFLQKPVRWLEAMDRYRADVSGGPNFAYDLCADRIPDEAIENLDLSSWTLAFCGAETVKPGTLKRFAENFSKTGFKASSLFPCYGLAEATLMATAVDRGKGAKTINLDGAEIVSCGKAGDGVEIAIVDPTTGTVRPEGKEGEIRIKGKNVATGYWNDHEESGKTFGNVIPGRGDVWLRTGDLGFLLDDELYVNGRLKDLIVLRGRNYHPSDIEEEASTSHPSLELNACAAFSIDDGDFVIAIEVRREARRNIDPSKIVRAIQAGLAQSFDLAAGEIVLLPPGSLPRTTSGKISRSSCREQYLSGTLKPIRKAPDEVSIRLHSEMEKKICHLVSGVLRIPLDSIEPELKLGEIGFDSLKRVELALTIEEAFDVCIDAESLSSDLDLSSLALMIRESSSRKAPQSEEADEFDPAGRELPLTPLQHAFLHPGPENPESFLEIVYLRTPSELDIHALKRGLFMLEYRFDSLRMRFSKEGDVWKQQYGISGTGISFEMMDASGMSAEEVRKNRTIMVESLKSGFDLAEGPVMRAVFFDRGENETGLLGLSFHHLVIDVTSVSIFVTSLQHAYQSALSGNIVKNGKCEYGKWLLALDAYGKKEALKQVDYWKEVCGESEDADCSLKPDPSQRWKLLFHPGLSPAENRRFVEKHPLPIERHHAFLAALAHAWCKMTGEGNALVLLEFHGRKAFEDTNPTTAMGWFVCRYPVKLPVKQDPAELFQETRKIMQQIPDEGIGYGLLMMRGDAMKTLRRPRIKLIYRGGMDDGFRENAMFPVIGSENVSDALYEAQENAGENCHVELYVTMKRGQLSWTVQYSPAYFDGEKASYLSEEIAAFIQTLSKEYSANNQSGLR